VLLEARLAQPTTETEAQELARKLYSLEVVAKALPGEYDDNFHLTSRGSAGGGASMDSDALAGLQSTADGAVKAPAGFVLKVMHPAREQSFIDLQCRALQHLAQRAPQLTLPRVYPSKAGNSFTAVTAPDGTERLVWLLTYVPGTMLVNARPHSPELLQSLGTFLGEMDSALADFAHPATKRELKWDLASAGWIREHLHHIADTSRRELVEKFLSLYEAQVVPTLGRLRRSVVYGDANDYNEIGR